MIKSIVVFCQAVKENVLFLVYYRRDKKRRDQELEDLELKMEMAQIELAFAMLAEQKARKRS